MKNKIPNYFIKYISIFSLISSHNLVMAACDVETDPFCSVDIDAPLDQHLFFLLPIVLIAAYSTIKKRNISDMIRETFKTLDSH